MAACGCAWRPWASKTSWAIWRRCCAWWRGRAAIAVHRFGHLHARTQGTLREQEDFARLFDRMEQLIGQERTACFSQPLFPCGIRTQG